MSGLYNVLFGESQSADTLLGVLGMTRDHFYRYRDCFLTEDGRIAVYTRGGGNNRDCWHDEPEDFEDCGDERCVTTKQASNRRHPCYLVDEDDECASTYATFYFRVPVQEDRAVLATITPEIARNDAWLLMLDAVHKT